MCEPLGTGSQWRPESHAIVDILCALRRLALGPIFGFRSGELQEGNNIDDRTDHSRA
jgi:hypothetical protein